MFPSTLQTDICLHIHGELLRHNSAFRAAVPSCKRSLANKLRVQHFLPRQYIIKQGDEVDKVFFILKGIVQVIVDGQTVLAIGKESFLFAFVFFKLGSALLAQNTPSYKVISLRVEVKRPTRKGIVLAVLWERSEPSTLQWVNAKSCCILEIA